MDFYSGYNGYKTKSFISKKNLFKIFVAFLVISLIATIASFSTLAITKNKNRIVDSNFVADDVNEGDEGLDQINVGQTTSDGVTKFLIGDASYSQSFYAKWQYEYIEDSYEEGQFNLFQFFGSENNDLETLDSTSSYYEILKLFQVDFNISNFVFEVNWEKEIYSFSYDYEIIIEQEHDDNLDLDGYPEPMPQLPDNTTTPTYFRFYYLLSHSNMKLVNGFANNENVYELNYDRYNDDNYNVELNGEITSKVESDNTWSGEPNNSKWSNDFNDWDYVNKIGTLEMNIIDYEFDINSNTWYFDETEVSETDIGPVYKDWDYYLGDKDLEIHFDKYYIKFDNVIWF